MQAYNFKRHAYHGAVAPGLRGVMRCAGIQIQELLRAIGQCARTQVSRAQSADGLTWSAEVRPYSFSDGPQTLAWQYFDDS